MRTNVYISNENYKEIKEYANKYKLSFSKAIVTSAISYIQYAKEEEKVDYIIRKLNTININLKRNFELSKQIYADMNIGNVINPKDSWQVQKFLKNEDIVKYEK